MGSRSRGPDSKSRSARRRVTGRDRIGPSSPSVDQPGALGNRATMEALGVTQGAAPFSIQRKCKECEEEEKENGSGSIQRAAKTGAPDTPSDPAPKGDGGSKRPATKTPPQAGVLDGDAGTPTAGAPGKEARKAGTGAAKALIANDDARSVAPEQMRKSEFLAKVRAGMAGLAPGGAGGGQAARWLDYFEASNAATLEDAIHRFVPGAERARTAHEYLRMLAAKARNEAGGSATSAKTAGKPSATGLGTAGGGMPGLSLKEGGAAASGAGGAGAAHGGGGHTGTGRGGDVGRAGASPAAVSRQLGPGTPLHSSVRASMEAAFGISFARVRLHTDRRAAELSDSLHARAFTVGEHVAFAPGEYRPDSAVGQALIAHELAHVVQQSGAARDTSVQPGSHTEAALEREADATAVQAVLAGQQGTRRGLTDVKAQAVPRLKSSLRLSRCGHCGRTDPKVSATPEIPATEEAVGKFIGVCINLTTKNRTKTSGLWYAIEYKHRFPDDWYSDYDAGLADDFYWDREKPMHWRVKEGRSASNAVKQWFKGLTIAECFSTAVAVQVNAIRAVLGDARFDELYGSQDVKMPKSKRLEMGVEGATPLKDLQQSIDLTGRGGVGTMGHRPAKVGEWYYFRNHPKYLLKHPAGIFQGENAFLLEDEPNRPQVWGGFGLAKVTEMSMLGAMAHDYNKDRTPEDRDALDSIKDKNGGKLPKEYEPGFFPDKIKVDMIPGTAYDYKDPWKGKTYKDGKVFHFVGGFDPRSGQSFSLEEVKKLLGPAQTSSPPQTVSPTTGGTTSGQ